MNVEWDPAKNWSNFRKRGINFEQVKAVFEDPGRVDEHDDREYDQDRWIVIGAVGSVVVHVGYTVRNGDVRLITARKPSTHEQARYFSARP